ncbi:hypothetical protein [Oscillibacter sp. 1-3]|uniref:hypothetical protein n=1 Tax=Oscillibacter sp. 1-3 TaxID=1235797 RepID=UPI0035298903
MLIGWPGIAMLVFPIFLPITDQLGSDRLWLAAVTASMLQTCFMIPPLGFDLFYMPRASCRRRSRSGRSARASSPSSLSLFLSRCSARSSRLCPPGCPARWPPDPPAAGSRKASAKPGPLSGDRAF